MENTGRYQVWDEPTGSWLEVDELDRRVNGPAIPGVKPNTLKLGLVDHPRGNLRQFGTGAVRDSDADTTRYDLIPPAPLRRLAETYAEGAQKYSDHNWLKGMPYSVTINHVIRHINLWLERDTTEDHLAHAAWGLFALMTFNSQGRDTELDDRYRFGEVHPS